MKSNIFKVSRSKPGLHLNKGKNSPGYSIGTKKSANPGKKGSRIVLGSKNQGTSNLMGVTK